MFTTLSFHCSKCNTLLKEEVEILDNDMNDEEEYETSNIITCKECNIDYHVSLINKGGIVLANVEGIENDEIYTSTPYIKSEELLPDDLEWYASYAFQSSYNYFKSSLEDMKTILSSKSYDYNQKEILKRMIFMQTISALESYLSDTLISRVITDDHYLIRLYEVDLVLNKEKLSTLSFIKNKDQPKIKAKEYLTSLM